MLESHVNRRSMNKLMGILIRLAGEAMRGEDRAEALPALSVPIIPQYNSKDISLLTTGDGHFPMKINMLYFPHTLENTHTNTRTGMSLSELGCQQIRLQHPLQRVVTCVASYRSVPSMHNTAYACYIAV